MKMNQIIEGHHYSNNKNNSELHRKVIENYGSGYVKVLTTYSSSNRNKFNGMYIMPKKSFAKWAKEDIT